MTPEILKKKPKRHFGGWISLNSTAHTRLNESSTLILFLTYHDRQMEFERWKFLLDVAIGKVDRMSSNTDQPFLKHQRDFLLSAKQLMEEFCRNINYNDPKLPSVSLKDHATELMVGVMKNCEKDLSAMAPKSSDSIHMDSSDSDSEIMDPEFHYRKVIDDYLKPSDGKMGHFQKKVSRKLDEHQIHPLSLQLSQYSKIYRELANEYCQKLATGNVHTYPLNKARYVFCLSSGKILRIGNSSSVIERDFSDSIRSIAGRRVKLRKNLINDLD